MKNEELATLIEKLDRRLQRVEALLKPKAAPEHAEMDRLIQDLKSHVQARIQDQWNKMKAPTENRVLAQVFGRRAQPVGGIDTITRILTDDQEIETVLRLTGAKLFVPKGILGTLTNEGLEALREYGMRESDVKRYRTREKTAMIKQASAELTADEEAEIERQNAEYVAQLEKQKGLI